MKFTKNQQKAISINQNNLSVSAGAGSGKTTVLVTKFSELLKNRVASISEILAVTFTNKAALDMKSKVRSKINNLYQNSEGSEKKYFKSVKDQFDNAQITTIHSFGLNALKKFPIETNIHPDSTLMDEIESFILLNTVVKNIISEEYKENEEISELISQIGNSSSVVESLIKVYQKARSLGGNPNCVSKKALDYYPIASNLLKSIKYELIESLYELKKECEDDSSKGKFITKWREINLSPLIKVLDEATSLNDYNVITVINTIQGLCSSPTKTVSDLAKSICHKSGKSGKLYVYESLLSYFDTIPVWKKVNDLINRIDIEYTNIKNQKRSLDYSDLEWRLLSLLENNNAVREFYQQQYKYVMVDEFQDTSPLQQRLINLISPYEQNKLFIVGDSRQSIYRFRAAEVEGFIKMEEEILNAGGSRIILEENFRSDERLIDFFNSFFSKLFAKTPITYDSVVAGKSGKKVDVPVKVIIPTNNKGLSSKERKEIEAKLIANRILSIKSNRDINFGDIAILFRALTDIKIYERQLQKQNIPYIVVGSRGFFNKTEIKDILNLLRYFIFPNNITALIGILRSPFFGVSDEGLYYLSKESCLDSLKECNSLAKRDQECWNIARSVISKMTSLMLVEPVSKVVRATIDKTNYKAVLLASKGYGVQAVANVDKLLDTIISLEKDTLNSKIDIITYLETLKESDAQFGEADINTNSSNAVQLMTVHQSKGLEFDTVIVAQCSRESRALYSDLLHYSKEYGLVARTRNYQDKLYNNIYYKLMKDYNDIKDLEESYRLLYVAATRAKNELIFSATPDKWPSNESNSWFALLVRYLDILEYPELQVDYNDFIKLEVIEHTEQISYREEHLKKEDNSLIRDLNVKLNPQQNERIKLTASALIDYCICHRLFYYKNILKLPTIDNLDVKPDFSDAVLGNIVHKVCEKSNNTQDIYSKLDWVISNTVIPLELKDDYKNRAKNLLSKYVSSQLITEIERSDEVLSEVKFTLGYDSYILTGVIDKVVLQDGIKVIDYKSGMFTKRSIEQYRVQIALYAYAVYKYYATYPKSLSIYFMNSGREYDYITDIKTLNSCNKILSDLITKIDNDIKSNTFNRNIANCNQCKYKGLCQS